MISIFKEILEYIVGWVEASRQPEYSYQYVIDNIELKVHQGIPTTRIRYKVVGCRTPLYESAIYLNNSHLFSLFRSDHAQIIVSIATIEALICKTPTEIIDRYTKYVEQCAAQFTEK